MNLPLVVALIAGGVPLVAGLIWRGTARTVWRGPPRRHLDRGLRSARRVSRRRDCRVDAVGRQHPGTVCGRRSHVGAACARQTGADSRASPARRSLVEDVPVGDIQIGDEVSVLPHEICPVDGEVVQGHGAMDESYLTGEPFTISKGPGATVLSGAINGDASLAIRATRLAADSRYAQIMHVMQDAEQRRPTLRRIGDQLGAWYTPVAIAIAALAWYSTGDPIRFLSVVVVATPCPLLIAIPVAIIGAISTAARRGVIVKDPAALEQLTLCRTMILDKTGTLTYGRPTVSDELYAPTFARERVLPIVAAMERYSRHPLAAAIVRAATDARSAVAGRRVDPGGSRRGLTRAGGQRRCADHEPCTRRCALHASARPANRPGMRRRHRRSVCGNLSIPRCAARRQPRVRRSPGTQARVHACAAGVRRPGIGSQASGRGGRHSDRVMPRRLPKRRFGS